MLVCQFRHFPLVPLYTHGRVASKQKNLAFTTRKENHRDTEFTEILKYFSVFSVPLWFNPVAQLIASAP